MDLNCHVILFILWITIEYTMQQTTVPNFQPICLDFDNALQCFRRYSMTPYYSVASRTCDSDSTQLPIIQKIEDRRSVIEKSLFNRLVPFWIDLRSVTSVDIKSEKSIKYKICGVGRRPDAISAAIVIFDYCYNERFALCCTDKLICSRTDKLLTWDEAVETCRIQDKTLYGHGASLIEIQKRFHAITHCSDCWIGLMTEVTSEGFSDQNLEVVVPDLSNLPRPGPCAVVDENGTGVSVPCEGSKSYHIICEKYVKKELVKGNTIGQKYVCPPEGCDKTYSKGGDIRVTSAVIFCVGLPVCICIGLVVGFIHRKKNPIYNRMPEQRQTQRQPNVVSYVPGGANTMF